MNSQALLQLVTEHMPNLEDFDMDMPWQGDVQELLENLPESIRTLRLRDIRHLAPEPPIIFSKTDSANLVAKKVRFHHALESFDVSGALDGKQAEAMIQFFKSCGPKLKTVRGRPFTWYSANMAVLRALSSIGFAWTELRRSDLSRSETDSNVARIIAYSPWSVLEVYTQWLGPMAVKAL